MPEQEKKAEELTPKEKELQEKLEQLQTQLSEEAKLRKGILENSDVMTVLQMQRDGKEFSISEKEKKNLRESIGLAKPSASNAENLNQMSNSELVGVLVGAMEDYISEQMTGIVKSATVEMDKRLAPVISNQGKLHNALIQQAAAAGVMSMRSSHQDFDQYSEEVIKVAQKTGLNLEDAYFLVKGKKGESTPSRERIETERPTGIHLSRQASERAQPSGNAGSEHPHSRRRDFRAILQEKAEEVISKRGG